MKLDLSLALSRGRVACGFEVVPTPSWCEELANIADGVVEVLEGSGGGRAHMGLLVWMAPELQGLFEVRQALGAS